MGVHEKENRLTARQSALNTANTRQSNCRDFDLFIGILHL